MELREVKILVISVIFIFIAITIFFVMILLYYQKKRFEHYDKIRSLEKQYDEEILQARIDMQEQTLNNISQEIHDNVGQLLSLAKIELSIINENAVFDKKLILSAKENLGTALTTLRSIAKSLSTDRIQNFDILETIKEEIDRIKASGVIDAQLDIIGVPRDIKTDKRLILFRALQECIQNILKHSQAKNFIINFNYTESGLIVTVIDDGVGFDTLDKAKDKRGLGIMNIFNRIKLINGEISMESSLGLGCKIEIKLPYAA